MITYSEFQKIIKFEQIVNDLRSGIPILLTHNKNFYTAIALESITKVEFEILAHLFKPKFLVISKERANYLDNKYSKEQIISIEKISFEEIVDISGLSLEKVSLEKYNLNELNISMVKEVLKTCIFSELHPSILLFESLITSDLNSANDLNFIHNQEQLKNYYREVSRAKLKLKFTDMPIELVAFRSSFNNKEHYALLIGDPKATNTPLVRLHSSCYTGDLLSSITCDCNDQFHSAIKKMVDEGGGIIMYLNQEGRGIGLVNKLRTYNLQEQGYDIVDANIILGFPDDARILWPAANMLKLLGIDNVRLLTNNPKKANALTDFGIKVSETVSHVAEDFNKNSEYFKVKSDKLGHKFN
ncbi:MAG: GTP cyclohydrolase II [Sphingobacteriia bacterium]|nr:GTP cyclohydrolase II [Sphingobacteriia bacterium]